MADRTVKVSLVANTAPYMAPMKDASAATLKLAVAQKEQAAAAKAAAVETVSAAQKVAVAEKQTALAAAEASAKAAVEDQAQVAAKKAVTAAAKELAAQEIASAKAVSAAQRESAVASREVAVAQKAVEEQTKKTSEAYTNTGRRFAVAGAALLGGFALVEKATTDFNVQMSAVAAAAGKTLPGELDKMRKAAIQAGEDTAYSATQAAQGEAELEKAGVSTADVLSGALSGSLNLAAAGQLSLGDAAKYASDEMNTFGLHGKDVGHIADVLAAGAGKSSADVGELANAMSQGGLVAHQMGLTLEDTTGVLAAFAQNGLHGADAGTSLKTMLERLAAPTGAAADQMKALGINAYDTGGNFVGVTALAGQLHDKLGPLTQAQRNLALQTIFGSDAIRAATVLYQMGAQGTQGWIDSTNQAGAASKMAAAQLDNLSGDMHKLGGSINAALIQAGSGGNDVLRELTQAATGAVNAFTSLPKPLQEIAVGFAGGGGASLLLVGGLATAAGKVGKLREGLKEAEATAEGLKGGLAKVGSFLIGPWGLAIAGTATAVAIFASKMHAAKVDVTDFTDAIKDDGNAIGGHTRAAVAADLANRGVYDSFTKLGVSIGTVTDAATGNADAMKAVQQATAAALKGGSIGDQAALGKNLNIIEATSGALHDQQRAQLEAAAATQQAASAGTDDAAVQARLAQSAKEAATGAMQRAAATRAAAEAARADASSTGASAAATKGAASASKGSTAATKADEAAKKAQTAAQKAAATAAKDGAKASTADAKASTAAANAADKGSYANSTAAGAAKSASEATKDKTRAQNADTTASNAAERAAKAGAKANDAAARAAAAHAKAAGADAQAQSDAAEAAREAAFEHQIGAEALKGWADAAKDTSHYTDVLDDSVTAEVDAMKGAQDQANALKDALDALNGVHINAGRAAVDVQNKVAGLTEAFAKNGKTLDITTQAGRDNMSAVYDLADAINSHAEAVANETGSVDQGNQALQASKKEFDKVLAAAGVSKDAIQQFNDELLAIPKTKPVTIEVDSAQALNDLRSFMKVVNGDAELVAVHIGGTTGRAGFATGGRIVGGGTQTSDSVPINASRDEYMLSAKAASRIGYAELDRINFGGGVPRMVRPQYVASVGGTTPHHAAAAITTSSPTLMLMPGASSAVATMINTLINTGQLVLKR